MLMHNRVPKHLRPCFLLAVLLCTVRISAAPQDTPLFNAVLRNDVQKVKILLSRGADANKSASGRPLGEAAANANVEIMKLLIAKGADVNATDAAGAPPLYYAVHGGNPPPDLKAQKQAIEFLLDKGADINYMNTKLAMNPLIQAAWNGKTDIVRLLIARGAKVNLRSVCTLKDSTTGKPILGLNGYTALMRAASRGRLEVIKILLQHGADVDLVSADGRTAITEAERFHFKEIAAMLREHSRKQK